MKKFKGILFGLLVLAPFAIISYFLYANFPTTPVLIIILIILMAGVLIAYRVYGMQLEDKSGKSQIKTEDDFPELENDLIYVSPSDFCSKLEKYTGKLFLKGMEDLEKEITLVEGDYNRLKDELTLKYTGGIRTTMKGISEIAVGNFQFVIFSYDEMNATINQKKNVFRFQNNILSHSKTGDLKIPRKRPIYVFSWEK